MQHVFPADINAVMWKLRRNHGWSDLINPQQVVIAYRLQLAVDNDNITEDDMAQEFAQAAYDAKRLSLRDGGIDFNRFTYVPQVDVEGQWYCTLEDEPHKLKCLGCSIRAQYAPPELLINESGENMIEAAMKSDDPSQWPAIEPEPVEPEPVEPHIAALNVVTCEDLFYNETLREELRKLGYHQDALALEIFGKAGAVEADAPGKATGQAGAVGADAPGTASGRAAAMEADALCAATGQAGAMEASLLNDYDSTVAGDETDASDASNSDMIYMESSDNTYSTPSSFDNERAQRSDEEEGEATFAFVKTPDRLLKQ
eukprot:gene20652-24755_t